MTHAQRRTHLFIWLLLGPALCAALLIAWRVRPAAPHRSFAPEATRP